MPAQEQSAAVHHHDAGPEVFTPADAEAAGLSRHMIATRLRSGEIRRLRRGLYCLAGRWDAADARGRHVLQARAAARLGPIVLSHLSAAAVWDLPLPPAATWKVQATVPTGTRPTRYLDGLTVYVASLPARDLRTVDGLAVTSPARTVGDCLRHLPATDAVAIADAALRRGLVDALAVAAVLRDQSAWPYASRCARAVPLVDGRRESWLESVSAVVLHGVGVPLGEAQVEILDERCRFVARVDRFWEEHGIVGEADGLAKYAVPDLGGVEGTRRALLREKAREDRLRDLGLEVIRWGTPDIAAGGRAVAAAFQRARSRHAGSRFTGRARRSPAIELAFPGGRAR
jgi:hypothetical protein